MTVWTAAADPIARDRDSLDLEIVRAQLAGTFYDILDRAEHA
jgi:hypothetical protein